MNIGLNEDVFPLIKTLLIFLIIVIGAGLFMSFSEYSMASNINIIFSEIPEEERVYTEAVITRIEVSGDDYTAYGILDDDEEKIERKLNFYSDEMKEDTKVPVYHQKDSYNYIGSKIAEPPEHLFNYDKSLKKLKFFGISFIILSLITIGVEIFEKVYIKKGN